MSHVQLVNTGWLSSELRAMVPSYQVGHLLDLLAYQWADPDCSLPDDGAVIANMAGLLSSWGSPEYAKLRAAFPPHPDKPGRLANPWLLKKSGRRARKPAGFSEGDMEVARWIWSHIHQLQPGRKEPNFEKWADTVRLMRERDGKSHEQIRSLFVAAHNDSFWRVNILGPDKLRKKWYDLELKLYGTHGRSAGAVRHPGGDARIPASERKVAKVRFGGVSASSPAGACEDIASY